ncbi:MAG: hypothetical protein ABWZ25_04945 [Chitinophagaceae bacterium]
MCKRFLILVALFPLFSRSQDLPLKNELTWYKLGDDSISISVTDFGGDKQPVYLNVHDNEVTSLQATLPVLKKKGGVLVKINNDGNRSVRFTLDGAEYAFDPNRIFSRNGIVHTLIRHKRTSNKAIEEIGGFADFFLSRIPENAEFIIALHNNANGNLSIESYQEWGEHRVDAAETSRIWWADPDDFMLTTDRRIYNAFNKNFNIVLQNNERVRQDGSLSVYYGEKGIAYLNCETEHGHLMEFTRMIHAIHDSLPLLHR